MTQPKVDKAPKRMLTLAETVAIADWLRAPGNLENCTTYQQVATSINLSKLPALRSPITARNAEGVMQSLGIPLHKEREPLDLEKFVRALADVVYTLASKATLEDPTDRDVLDEMLVKLREMDQ